MEMCGHLHLVVAALVRCVEEERVVGAGGGGGGGNCCPVFMNCRQYTDTDGDVWTLTLSLQLLSGVLSGCGGRLEGDFNDNCLVHMDCG